jgi:hypothetical protein|nr:MAG TPA: hypothetical protein [Inoviridae sp.]
MDFCVTYELFCGEVLVSVSSKNSDPAVLINANLFDKKMTFKIPCPDDYFASTVSAFIKNRFDSGDSIFFHGTFPHDNLVIVSVPSDFLSGVV